MKKKKMKKIGIFLAALVIAMFLVGTVAAMKEICPPDQREKFCEESAVQGVGYIEYSKSILDKAIAVDVKEYMRGETGENGSFAMTISEVMTEGTRVGNASYKYYDPINATDFNNFACDKMIQFEAKGKGYGLNVTQGFLEGQSSYKSPRFNGGIGAEVEENYFVTQMQKEELTTMRTTAVYNKTPPYNAQQLQFSTRNAFIGEWGTDSRWKKVCTKDIEHHQFFRGDFQVDKTLVFKEEVTEPCKGEVTCICGDC
ncbi:hypothetical protein C5S53_04700 [Methanophagales archaeon]|nr:hypothetical protein C5S53_04700 [Methanophagales archaeon]